MRRKATPKEREAMHKTQPLRTRHVYGRTCNKHRMITITPVTTETSQPCT